METSHAPYKVSELAIELGLSFRNANLLLTAVTHSSYANEHREEGGEDNERLEFLGDAVLQFVVADALYKRSPSEKEGVLTRLRAGLVDETALTQVAKNIGLERFLRMRTKATDSILANALEALVGAVYMDQGLSAATAFIEERVMIRKGDTELLNNPKGDLQEFFQAKNKTPPVYREHRRSGLPHEPKFEVGVYHDEKLLGTGRGGSLHEAGTEAARQALQSVTPAAAKTDSG